MSFISIELIGFLDHSFDCEEVSLDAKTESCYCRADPRH